MLVIIADAIDRIGSNNTYKYVCHHGILRNKKCMHACTHKLAVSCILDLSVAL